jgi:hypothetical protein
MTLDLSKKSDESGETAKEKEPPLVGIEAPAIYCDTYAMSYWPDKVRIAFAEWIRGKKYVRTTVLLDMDVVKDVLQSLQEIVDEMKDQKKKE